MLLSKIERYIEREMLFRTHDKILIALSGGADSVALFRMLVTLGYECEAAHCNFNLRGEESLRDERFVRNLCKEFCIPLHIKHFDTADYSKENNISVEMAARDLRYTWFEELRKQVNAEVIAVAHHQDDSVETFLLNLIRGTGITGLCGIRPRNGYIVRPLLAIDRREVLLYLESLGQQYVTDSTNLQDEYTRNKIRLNLLPLMENINPSVKKSIAATAFHLSGAMAVYNCGINRGKEQVVREDGSILIEALMNEPSPQSLLFEILYPLGFNTLQINDIFLSLSGQPGRLFRSKEWEVLKDRTCLLIYPRKIEKEKKDLIYISEEGVFVADGFCLKIERKPYSPDFRIPNEKHVACFDRAKINFPLILRLWKKGDRFVPFGMRGRKNVSDYLTDRKMTLHEKEKQYVLCDEEDKIIWLVGERSDNRFRVSEETEEILLITKK